MAEEGEYDQNYEYDQQYNEGGEYDGQYDENYQYNEEYYTEGQEGYVNVFFGSTEYWNLITVFRIPM
jgi:hypothetical protein